MDNKFPIFGVQLHCAIANIKNKHTSVKDKDTNTNSTTTNDVVKNENEQQVEIPKKKRHILSDGELSKYALPNNENVEVAKAITAEELFNLDFEEIPFLLDKLLPKVAVWCYCRK